MFIQPFPGQRQNPNTNSKGGSIWTLLAIRHFLFFLDSFAEIPRISGSY